MPATTTLDWTAARAAVAAAGPRLTSMLRTARHPEAPALGSWDVSQVATHISHAVDTVTAMSEGGGNLIDDISGLASLTTVMVAGEGRRTLAEVADRIDASTARFLAAMDAAERRGDDDARSWMVRGTVLRPSNLTCHILNELTVHGLDIARAEGVPWPIDRSHANLIVQGFLFPSLGVMGRSMVDQDTARGVRARMQIHLRGGGGSACLRFDDGNLTVEPVAAGPVDCHLSVDPAAFLLVAWARIGQTQAILRGQLLAWGRRPWLGLQMRSWVRTI